MGENSGIQWTTHTFNPWEGCQPRARVPRGDAMTERPILFSAPMVRALLDGRKTQTRRVVKSIELARGEARGVRVAPNTFCYLDFDGVPGLSWRPFGGSPTVPYPPEKVVAASPYGAPGDRLWVKETWRTERAFDAVAPAKVPRNACIQHAEEEPEPNRGIYGKTRPSIFMMRWMSRITLEVTGVRVERLQEISETDAKAEGVELPHVERETPDFSICPTCGGTGLFTDFNPVTYGARPDTDCTRCDSAAKRYRWLWESINGADSWAANPWVWVVEFKSLTVPAPSKP